MKALDRAKLAAAIVLIFAGTNIFAKNPETSNYSTDRFAKQFSYITEHNYPMVVESSIFVSLQVKEKYPNENYSSIVDKLEDLAKSGPTMTVRYKAQLAAIYFSYYDYFKDVKVSESKDANEFFKTIAEKIEKNTFGHPAI